MPMVNEFKGGSNRKAEDNFKNDDWKGLDLVNENTRSNTGTFLRLENCVVNNNGKIENRRGFEQIMSGIGGSSSQGFYIYKNQTPTGLERLMFVATSGKVYISSEDISLAPNFQWQQQTYLKEGVVTDIEFQTDRPVEFKQIDRFLFLASGEGIYLYDGSTWTDITQDGDAYDVTTEQLDIQGPNIANPNGSLGVVDEKDGSSLPQITKINNQLEYLENELIEGSVQFRNIPGDLRVDGDLTIPVLLVFVGIAEDSTEAKDFIIRGKAIIDLDPPPENSDFLQAYKFILDPAIPEIINNPAPGKYPVKAVLFYDSKAILQLNPTLNGLYTNWTYNTFQELQALILARTIENITIAEEERIFVDYVLREYSLTVLTIDPVTPNSDVTSEDIRTCNLIETYKGRVYLAGSITSPRIIFSSDVINYNYFPFFQSFEPISDKIEPFLRIKKRRDTLMIPSLSEFPTLVGDGPIDAAGTDIFSTKVLYPSVGVAAPRSLKFIDSNLMYLSNDGIRLSKPNAFDENSILNILRVDKTIRNFVRIEEDAIAFFTDGKYYLLYNDGTGLIYDFDHDGAWSTFKTNLSPLLFHLEDQGIHYFLTEDTEVYVYNKDIYTDIEGVRGDEVNVPIPFDIFPNVFTGNNTLDNITKSFKRLGIKFNILDSTVQTFKVSVFVDGINATEDDKYELVESEIDGSLSVSETEIETFLKHTGLTIVDTWVLGDVQDASILPDRLTYNIHDFQLNLRNTLRAAKGEAITFRLTGEAVERFELTQFNFSALLRKKRRRRGQVYGKQ